MQTKLKNSIGLAFFIFILNISLSSANLLAQSSFILSKNSDFSTDDQIFNQEDTLFMKVIAPTIDYTDIDKNEFELKAERGGDDFEGTFTNLLNFTYTASLPLLNLNSAEEQWRWEARIRDDSGHEFRAGVEISILGGVQREELEIKGMIQGLGDNFLVVQGVTIFVDASTIIKNKKDDVLISFEDLALGQNVEVKALRQDNGNLLALIIEVKNRKKGEIVVKSVIEEIGTDSLVVLGTTFFVDENTIILDDKENPISLSDLKVGLRVKIHARPQSDGTWLARLIKVEEEREGKVELTGFIEEIALKDSILTVSGITFFINNSTQIFDNHKNPISFDDLAVGQLVEIHAIHQLDGTLLATKIELEDEVLSESEIEVTGEIKEKGDNQLVVSAFTFLVDENTVILDDHKREISFAELQVGFVVEVKAVVQPDGSFLATRIKIEDRLKEEIEVTGLIEELGDSSLVVSSLTFMIDENTQILDQNKNPIQFEDLQEGLTVEIHAEILTDSTLLATKIEIENKDKNEIELTGTIETIGMDSLTVFGVTFFVDANTLILDKNKSPINFSDLSVGQLVEVKGILQANGSFLAIKIEIKDRLEDEVEVKSIIESLTDTTITVLGLTFNVIENTIVLDSNKNPILFSDLTVGLFVEVRGELLPGGTLVALRIKVEDVNQNELEVKGPIDSLGTNNLFVLGINFKVDSRTEILDKKNNPISFSNLKAGQFVEVRALRQPDGSFLATRIKVEDVLVIMGAISNIGVNSFSIFKSELHTDENTLVLDALNQTLTFEELIEGQMVETRATRLSDGTMLASKIKILNIGSVTSINNSDDEFAIPKAFSLEQNYPNPFNPTTIITFKLPESDLGQYWVNLVIYNLLGQTVRTLVDQPYEAGVHQIQWDGRDDFGRPLSSGIYLYRLKSGRFTETRRMVLIK